MIRKMHLTLACAAMAFAVPVTATPVGVNLIVNGDAEAGNLTGWSTTIGSVGVVASSVYAAGLTSPDDHPHGGYVFSPGGSPWQSASAMWQTFDVSDLASTIDADLLSANFTALIQSRTVPWARDLVVGQLSFYGSADATGVALTSFDFDDPSPDYVFDWQAVDFTTAIPELTRSIMVKFSFSSNGCCSTDSGMDNASFVLLGDVPTGELPEPGGLALAAAALIGLGLTRRTPGRR